MASAQVLRKQELKDAGKRKLEEFRKKKAAERAKTNASDGQNNTSDAGSREKQLSDSERGRPINSDVARRSDAVGEAISDPPHSDINKVSVEPETFPKSSFSFPGGASADLPAAGVNYAINSFVPLRSQSPSQESSGVDTKPFLEQLNVNNNPPHKESHEFSAGVGIDQSVSIHLPSQIDQSVSLHLTSQSVGKTSGQYRYDGFYGSFPSKTDSHFKNFSVTNSDSSHSFLANGFPENSGSVFHHENPGYGDGTISYYTSSSHEVMHSVRSNDNYVSEVGEKIGGLKNDTSAVFDTGVNKLSGSVRTTSANYLSPWSLDPNYSGFSSSNYGQSLSSSGTGTRKSRPSFLDSINISRGPSESPSNLFGSKVHPEDNISSHVSQNLTNGVDLFKPVMDKSLQSNEDLYSRKQNENFMALEQHIEDLTQEKFSLQRALDASRSLAESLAAENSALTENYNQQGSVVNQLRSDMEELQREIRANLLELEAVKVEYANAQLECNAADERAKLLASEVIGLEEKALRLRSNELKLQKQLEESQAEISTFKKKMSTIEKDRQDLQSTIDALQEEKKLLHTRLRKAYANGKLVEVSKSTASKRDVSTSTEDLGETNNTDLGTSNTLGDDVSSLPLLHDSREFSLQDRLLAIPPDQMRMIENINTLISELTLEKEELVQALSAESSQSSKLKELNKELTRKLEVQTQRLELLTAQSMANDGIQTRQPDSRPINDNTPYADEGDEVVERVLGWIMKLLPGGPSKRRTSKRL